MKAARTFFLVALLVGGLAACNDDNDDDIFVTPTPTPSPTASPSPTPADDGDDIDGDDPEDPEDPTPTPTPGTATGAPMTQAQEAVEVIEFTANANGTSLLYVQRANAEVWGFDLTGVPQIQVGDDVVFSSTNLVFGDLGGTFTAPFPGGRIFPITAAVRVR